MVKMRQKGSQSVSRKEHDGVIKEKYRVYFNWGVTVFLIILCSILAFFFFYRFESVQRGIKVLNEILAPILSGLVIAYLLNPVMDTLIRLTYLIPGSYGPVRQKVCKGVAILASEAFLIAIIGFMVGTILPQVVDTLRSLVMNIDKYGTALEEWIEPLLDMNPAIRSTSMGVIQEMENRVRDFLQNDIMSLMSTLTSGVVEVGRFIYNFVLGFIVSIYLLASRDKLVGRMKKLLYAFVNRDAANTTLAMAQKTNAMFKGFIVGKIVDSSIIGVLCFLGMSLLKLPYALFISVIVGVTNVIPYFGPFLGAIPSALLILIDSPIQCLIFSLFILFLQQLDGNFIGPKVLGNTTGLSSLGVLFSILVGGGLFGLAGMILSVPACGVLYSLIKAITDSKLRKRGLPTNTERYVFMQGLTEDGKLRE